MRAEALEVKLELDPSRVTDEVRLDLGVVVDADGHTAVGGGVAQARAEAPAQLLHVGAGRCECRAAAGEGDGSWSIRIYYNPLVPWIWLGAVIMMLGGLVSLSDRRLRVGAPRRAKSRAPEIPSPQPA